MEEQGGFGAASLCRVRVFWLVTVASLYPATARCLGQGVE